MNHLSASAVYALFLVFFITAIMTKLWLSYRQSRAVWQHRATVPAAFQGQISLEAHQKSADYTLAKERFFRFQLIYDAVVLLLFLQFGLNLLAVFAINFNASAIGHDLILLLSFAFVSYLLALPWSIYATFVLEARFGFNKTTPKTFIADQIKGLILGAVLITLLGYVALWLLYRALDGAAFYLWLFWLGFSLLMLWLYPTVIAPLFNRFTPLGDGELKNVIEALLKRTGFTARGIFVMDGSRRSGHGNAYFTGIGRAKRIVFFDTLIERLSASQIEAVLAHELGHFKRHHVLWQMMIRFALALPILLIMASLIKNGAFYLGLGVIFPSMGMGLLLFMLILPYFLFPFSPMMSALSRRHEYQADRFAAENSNAKALIDGLLRLYEDNASSLVVDKYYSLFYLSHPHATERISALQKFIDLATKEKND